MNLRAFNLGRAFALGVKHACKAMAQDSELVEFQGKKGHWITSNGAHIFVREDGTPISSNARKENDNKREGYNRGIPESLMIKARPTRLGVITEKEQKDFIARHETAALWSNNEGGYCGWIKELPSDCFFKKLWDIREKEFSPPKQEGYLLVSVQTKVEELAKDLVKVKTRQTRFGEISEHQQRKWGREIGAGTLDIDDTLAGKLGRIKESELTHDEKAVYYSVISLADKAMEQEGDYEDEPCEADPYFSRMEKFVKHFFPDDEEQGEEYFQAINSWYDFSDLYRGEEADEEDVSKIEEFMEQAPKYKGELWRAISLKQKDVDRLRSGEPWTDKSLTSWTNDNDTAISYAILAAPKGKNLKQFVLHIDGIDGAVDIGNYSPYEENEVLAPRGVTYRYVGETTKGNVLHINVERVK